MFVKANSIALISVAQQAKSPFAGMAKGLRAGFEYDASSTMAFHQIGKIGGG